MRGKIKSQKLIEFMAYFNLLQLLRRRTNKYHSSSGKSSTIDLVFISDRRAQTQPKYKLHNAYYRSDHKVNETELNIIIPNTIMPPRLFFTNAPWIKIQENIQENLNAGKLHIFFIRSRWIYGLIARLGTYIVKTICA